MTVVAGPPGSGKSALFPPASHGVACFNADDRAAQLNGGSYHQIPPAVRAQANREFEAFILDHIEREQSFAFESTLRTDITFRQAERARSRGFEVVMDYVALESVDLNLKRIRARYDAGGHAASESVLRAIHTASLQNLPRALRELDGVVVFDNTLQPPKPRPLLRTARGRITWTASSLAPWLIDALHGTEFDLVRHDPSATA